MITGIKLTFLTQENKGFFVFFDKLSPAALEKHFEACLDDFREYEEDDPEKDIALAKERMHEEFENCIWLLNVEDSDAMREFMDRNDDGRDTLNAFGDELNAFAGNVIQNYEFPEEEGVQMWLYAVRDGEEIWENG